MKGTVFSVALNHQSQMDAWNEAFHQPPYQTPPQTPVWFIKPHNTHLTHLQTIPDPRCTEPVMSGATLGLVVGKKARKVTLSEASEYIAGFLLANELSLPEESFYRPEIKAKCRDGFCPLGSEVRQIKSDNLTIITEINGEVADRWYSADLIRSAEELLCALSDFATLNPGDVILLGTPHQRVAIQPGDRVTVKVEGFAPLENRLSPQGVAA
ncbi:MAG: fumarylacetoacetate hydrolase family protein [Enterobacteriaceae bacterium]